MEIFDEAPSFFSQRSSENVTLEWTNICYSVRAPFPSPSCSLIPGKIPTQIMKEKKILHNLSGKVEAGQFVAIIGPSGAGKTTLLNILARKIRLGVSGQTRIQSDKICRTKRQIGHSPKVLFSHLTVRETVSFALKIRKKLAQSVQQILKELDLLGCADQLVESLSVAEKKKVSVASQLAFLPALILLDEPTSGLDFLTARRYVQILRQMANNGHTILISIDRPSSAMFNLFDKILLLAKGGFLAYEGKPRGAVRRLASYGFPSCPSNTNHADYLLDCITSERTSEDGRAIRWALIDDQRTQITVTKSPVSIRKKSRQYCLSFYEQFALLTQRSFKQAKRETLSSAHIVQVLCLALLFGVAWFQQNTQEESIRSRAGFMFYSVIFWLMRSWLFSLQSFSSELIALGEERVSATYSLTAYFLAKLVADIAIGLVLPSLFATIVFWMVGLSMTVEGFCLYLSVLWLVVSMGSGMGMLIATLIPDLPTSSKISTFLYTFSIILACFLVSKDDSPDWVSWMRWISLVKYPYEALMISDLSIVGHQFAPSSPSIYTSFPIKGEDVLRKFNIETELWQSALFLIGVNIGSRLLTYLTLLFPREPSLSSRPQN